MNENFVYEEFDPKRKGGRASGVSEVFQATNSYIKNNIKALLCFALVYIVLIGGFLAINVGSIMQISSDVLKEGYRYNDDFMSDEFNRSIDELDEAESFEDVMNGIGSLKRSIREDDFKRVMSFTRSSVLMMLSFIAMGILIQLIGIAFITHVNKWIFKMDRGFKDVSEAVFIKFIKSIAIAIVFGLITGMAYMILPIFAGISDSNETVMALAVIIITLLSIYIGTAGSFAHYLVTTNKYTGIGTCISTGFGLANRFIFNWIGKMLIIYIGTLVVGGLATLIIALIATGLRSPWVFALTAIPWICAALYSTVYSQMAMCDYTNQYEFRTGNIVRDYDYYDIYDDDGYDYTDRPRRYQDDEARSVDDFYNNLDR